MTKNTTRIVTGLREIVRRPYEVVSGIVTAIDTGMLTIDVRVCGQTDATEGVLLNTLVDNSNGLILFPKVGSNVVIASIDGPGMWCLVKASEITKAQITIEHVIYTMTGSEVNIQNGDVVFNMSDSLFKIKTQNESLFELLKDCFTYLMALTVPTSSGPSGVPVNVADFNSLLPRLNNLLKA